MGRERRAAHADHAAVGDPLEQIGNRCAAPVERRHRFGGLVFAVRLDLDGRDRHAHRALHVDDADDLAAGRRVEIRGDKTVRFGDQLMLLHFIAGLHDRFRRLADALGDDDGITVKQRRFPDGTARAEALAVAGGVDSPVETHDITGILAHFSALHSGSCFSIWRCSSAVSSAPVGQPAAWTSSCVGSGACA